MRWIAGAGNHSCWLGCYEPNKQRELQARVRPGDVVYDLGANAGYFSLVASILAGPEGHVVSFEPLPENVILLRRHLELNGIRNCRVVEAAVASREGIGRFQSAHNLSMGHLSAGEEYGEGNIQVRVVTLDGLVGRGQIPPPSIVKCDVEGADLDALRGAEETLRRYHPVILLDKHSDEVQAACCDFLGDLGYVISSLDRLPLQDSVELCAVWRP